MKKIIIPLIIVLAAFSYWALETAGWSFTRLWITSEQQGEQLMARGEYTKAAELFIDPVRKGTAYYRAGQFKKAVAAFQQIDTAQTAFNRGNALIMLGKYDDAIAAYTRALELEPGWIKAKTNRNIAVARKKKLTPKDDHGGTGGELEADEFVFDDHAKKSSGNQEQTIEGDKMSDEEIRALWLRRVQTKPADFLKAKFAYQYSKKDLQ